MAFLAAGVGLAMVAAGVVRGARWVLVLAVVGFGGQIWAVAGTLWELTHGIDAGKARELRLRGVDPTVGVAINLAYSAASVLFGWFALRCYQARRADG
ncbi:hypothetical protein R8Z50_22180 [Longispora sp. K20-0274]|uniref:hypothetical protein n=1 Tax=Longispora sp. K20-0274 TaxID=3088255 RepID=UPI00399B9ED1